MKERNREAGDHDGGSHGHAAEQQHQPDMQPRSGGAAAALDPDPGQPAGQHGTKQQDRRKVGQHKADAHAGHADRTARHAP